MFYSSDGPVSRTSPFCTALSCCEKRTLPSPAGNDCCRKLSTLLRNLLCPTCHKYTGQGGGSSSAVCVWTCFVLLWFDRGSGCLSLLSSDTCILKARYQQLECV
ncbi:hypothetical protein ILYODFUR_014850 [Ilyodon furcidens]|uniref:Uncharacterized protein n=1 Tax=Ilyodon furcidens TaxID=33524 RepID=A0ABV0V556_9TELE